MSPTLAGMPQRYLRTPEAADSSAFPSAPLKSTGSTERGRAIRSSAAVWSIASKTFRPGWSPVPKRQPPTLVSAPCSRRSVTAP